MSLVLFLFLFFFVQEVWDRADLGHGDEVKAQGRIEGGGCSEFTVSWLVRVYYVVLSQKRTTFERKTGNVGTTYLFCSKKKHLTSCH